MKKALKKRGVFIDKITEDSFHENLLLGLTSLLRTSQFVTAIKLEPYPPATAKEVDAWENTSGLILPQDLRDFYLSTNGFSLTYKFQYDKTDSEELNHIIAGIEINPLSKMEKISSNETTCLTEGGMKLLSSCSNVYTLAKIDDGSHVVLAQFNTYKSPNIWVYYRMKNFYFLCEDFTTYFRMALAHLGVPAWQLFVLNGTLPEWSGEMIQILAPGIFDRQFRETSNEVNKIDSGVFRICDDDLTSEGQYEVKSNSGRKKTPKSKPKK